MRLGTPQRQASAPNIATKRVAGEARPPRTIHFHLADRQHLDKCRTCRGSGQLTNDRLVPWSDRDAAVLPSLSADDRRRTGPCATGRQLPVLARRRPARLKRSRIRWCPFRRNASAQPSRLRHCCDACGGSLNRCEEYRSRRGKGFSHMDKNKDLVGLREGLSNALMAVAVAVQQNKRFLAG